MSHSLRQCDIYAVPVEKLFGENFRNVLIHTKIEKSPLEIPYCQCGPALMYITIQYLISPNLVVCTKELIGEPYNCFEIIINC